jgi:hypothetical protein
MKSQVEKINEVTHKLAAAMYEKSQAEGGAEGGAEGESKGESPSGEPNSSTEEDVVDAEFEDISKK